MEPSGRLDLTLPPRPSAVAEARARVVEAIAPTLGDGDLDRLRLLVSELVTNAVRNGGSTTPLEVRARWDGSIRVEVIDHGDGFMPAPRTGELDEPGGFGLFLVGRLADRWGVEGDHATRVWFEIHRD